MIRDKLIPLLQQRYSDKRVSIGLPPNPVAVFQAQHPSVGDLVIWDDGDEVTIAIGEITHGHFNPYNPELDQEEIEKEVTEEVLDFLEDIFADKIQLWKSREGGSGGWQHLEFSEVRNDLSTKVEYYVWSGPYRT
jgi:hypothetical protein